MRDPRTALEEATRLLRDDGVELEEKLQYVTRTWRSEPVVGLQIVRHLLEQDRESRQVVVELGAVNEELREAARRLASPPLYEGVFLGPVVVSETVVLARVAVAGSERLLEVASGLDLCSLRAGDRVHLTSEANAVLRRVEAGPDPGGVVVFERWAPGGRAVVKDRDQDLVVRTAADLAAVSLKPGDLVRLDRQVWMVMERVEAGERQRFAATEEATDLPREAFAGYDRIRETVLRRVIRTLAFRELARAYGVRRDNDRILLFGPPGCGKTLLARTLAAELQRETGERCAIMKVNGAAGLYSPWVGVTEQNIQALIRELKETDAGYAVLFLDEVDGIARIRGGPGNVHSDRFLSTFLAEIEGFDGRARILMVAATNRADTLDPAWRERFAWEIEVPRPRMDAARAIFRYHLGAGYPYAVGDGSAEETRAAIIESAVAQLYDPNATGSAIATVRLRDGKSRAVAARDLMSGRLIEQVCLDARERAFQRAVEGGAAGITAADMDGAVASAIERLRGTLTLHNVHVYLTDLPQDVGVVAVEPAARTVARRRYAA